MLDKNVNTKIKKLVEDAKLPTYASNGDSGADLYSIENRVLRPGERALIRTGIAIALPEGHEAQVRSKSGIALKNGVMCLNSPGTVDESYRGEVGVILYNSSCNDYEVKKGEKIAQMVIKPVYQSNFEVVEELDETTRGGKGFGSTGLK